MKKNYKLFSSGLIAFAINSASAQCPTPTLVTATPSVICAGATTSINATVTINDGTNDIDLIKNAPIPVGSQLQVIDGGAKYVVQSGDVLKVNCDVASAMDVWVSAVDDIST